MLDTDRGRAARAGRGARARFGAGRAAASVAGRRCDALDAASTASSTRPRPAWSATAGRPSRAQLLRPELWVADVVYRPLETELLRDARAAGCRTLDGGGMVVLQAAGSFERFTGARARPRPHARATSPTLAPMTRARGIATVCLSGTLEEKLRAAAAAGFDAVELFENDLIGSPLRARPSVRELRRRARARDRALPAVPRLRGGARSRAHSRRAEAKFAVMEELGADTILVCSNVSPAAIDDDALAAEQLRELAERAAARGMRIAYEALAWGRHVNTFDHAWRIVERADHPALGTCLDSFHILSRGSDPAGIRDIPGEKIFFLQLADAPRMDMDVLQWSRHHRCFPGQGGLDVAARPARTRWPRATPARCRSRSSTTSSAPPTRERMAVDAMRSLLILEDALPPRAGRAAATATRSSSSGSTRPARPRPRRRSRRSASPTPASTAPSPCSCGSRATRGWSSTAARRRASRASSRWRSRARPGAAGGARRGAAGAGPARAPAPGRGRRCARSSPPTARR